MMIKELLLKNISSSRLEFKSYKLSATKMARIDSLFIIKTAAKPYPLGPHIAL